MEHRLPRISHARNLLSGRRRGGLLFAAGLIAFFAAYAWFLGYQEQRVRASFAELRNSNPELYLNEIGKVVGFERYLAEFRVLKGYQVHREDVPSFLLGRWALFPDPKRVSDVYFAETCIDSIAFEDRLVRISRETTTLHEARYRLQGSTVSVRIADFGEMPVELVSYGVRLHHIELTPPGASGRRYGYLCK